MPNATADAFAVANAAAYANAPLGEKKETPAAAAPAPATADADALALAYAIANAPLGEKKETPPVLAYASAFADATANAPLGEKKDETEDNNRPQRVPPLPGGVDPRTRKPLPDACLPSAIRPRQPRADR